MTREERRGKLNAVLSDAEMAATSGGVATGDVPEPKFKVGYRFKHDPDILDGYVTGIDEYIPQWHEWMYQVHMLDKDGWFDDLYEESNMEPY